MDESEADMAKVVITKLEGARPRDIRSKDSAVEVRRVGKDGRLVSIRTVSTDSGSFGKDFTRIFGANVKKAREENKRLTGAPDSAPAKR
jgi:hypothetical protein